MIDTMRTGWGGRRKAATAPRRQLALAIVLGVIALVLPAAPRAHAAEAHGARVLWVREPRVYLAAPDSGAFEEGTRLRFEHRGKRLAAAEVVRVLDSALVVATITSGTLRSVTKWDRLRVVVEPPEARRPALLRIGFPGAARARGVGPCERRVLRLPGPASLYRAAVSGERSWRLERDSSVATERPWPDTLVVRLFDESSDEEIALERGELDAAVFGPGEASRYILEKLEGGAPIAGGGVLLAARALFRQLRPIGPDSLAAIVDCEPPRRSP